MAPPSCSAQAPGSRKVEEVRALFLTLGGGGNLVAEDADGSWCTGRQSRFRSKPAGPYCVPFQSASSECAATRSKSESVVNITRSWRMQIWASNASTVPT